MELLDDVTRKLSVAVVTVGTCCAEYARLLEAIAAGTTTLAELTSALAIASEATQALAGLMARHEALREHVERLLLLAEAGDVQVPHLASLH